MLIKRDWSIMPIFFVKFSCLCNDCIKLNFNYSWDTQSFSLSQHYKETVTTTLLSFVMSLSIKMFSGLCKDQLTLNKLIFTNKLSAIMGIKNCPLISTIYIFSNRALTLVMKHTYTVDSYLQVFMCSWLAWVLLWAGCLSEVKLIHKFSKITFNVMILLKGQIYCHRRTKFTKSFTD